MQTFLPYPDFARSAACLDRARLGKQQVEVVQIYRTLRGLRRGWRNHPAVLMWRGFENALLDYGMVCCTEWKARGYNGGRTWSQLRDYAASVRLLTAGSGPPPWFGDPAFHASHRSNLLRKDPGWYGRFGWAEPPTLPYVWPVPAAGTARTT